MVTFLAFQPNATSEPPSPSAAGGSSSKATAGRRGRVGEAPSSSSASPSAAANASSASSSSAVALTFDGPSPAPSLKGELGFDYLAVDDIAPFPEASLPAVTHKTLAALQTADWPEIFHTLNSVRRRPTASQPCTARPPSLRATDSLTHSLLPRALYWLWLPQVRRLSLHHGCVLERHVHGLVRDVLKVTTCLPDR